MTSLPPQDGQNYHWSDGSDEVYAHWDVSEDEEDFVTGECVYLDVSGGWRRADCERPLPGALCHVPPPSQLVPSLSVFSVCFVAELEFRTQVFRMHNEPTDDPRDTGWRMTGAVF